MVLYFSLIPTNLVYVLIHRLTERANEKAALYVNEKAYESRGLDTALDMFVEKHVFDSVIRSDYSLKHNFARSGNIENDISSYFFDVLNKKNVDLNDYDELIIVNDDWDVDINLTLNILGISYTWLQTTALSFLLDRKSQQYKQEINLLIDNYKAMGPLAPMAKPSLRTDDVGYHQELNEKKLDYSEWNFVSDLNALTKVHLEKLLECYSCDMNMDFETSTLMILNSDGYGRAGKNTIISSGWESIIGYKFLENKTLSSLWYNKALDYYDNPEPHCLYIKTHPNDPLSDADIIRLYGHHASRFPNAPMEIIAEYMRKCGRKINCILGVASSSKQVLDSDLYSSCVFLGGDYFENWFYYDSIYVVYEMLAVSSYTRFLCGNSVIEQFKNMNRKLNNNLAFELYTNQEHIQNECIILNAFYDKVPSKDIIRNNLIIILNVGFSDEYMDAIYTENLSCLEIVKYPFDNCLNNYIYPEYIYIYDSNDEFVKNHYITKVNFNSKYKIQTRIQSKYELVEMIEKKQLKKDINRIYDQLFYQKNRVERILLSYAKLIDESNINAVYDILKKEDDFLFYLKLLKICMPYFMVFIAVKDTPGDMISDEIMNEIIDMGFDSFTKELWVMYVGVYDGNCILCNKRAAVAEENLEYKTELNGMHIYLSSQAWKTGNKAEIIIDNENFSINKRGINMVIINKSTHELVDSVGFDGHRGATFVHRAI
jgi:hypothetical protein